MFEDQTGYACLIERLVSSWRYYLDDDDLPFGIVQLASGTNEGYPQSMAAFRHAQTAGCGRLPCDRLPNVFAAQGHDVGDPWSDDSARCAEPYAPYACQNGDDNLPNETPSVARAERSPTRRDDAAARRSSDGIAATPRARLGISVEAPRCRRGRDADLPPRHRGAADVDLPSRHRGAAATATRISRRGRRFSDASRS